MLRFVGGFLLTLVIGPGILLAASWALGAALGKVLFYFGVAAVAVTEVALVVWLVIQVVKAVRGGGFAERPAGGPLRSGHGQALGRERAEEPRVAPQRRPPR